LTVIVDRSNPSTAIDTACSIDDAVLVGATSVGVGEGGDFAGGGCEA
jgi:hypothetical protein